MVRKAATATTLERTDDPDTWTTLADEAAAVLAVSKAAKPADNEEPTPELAIPLKTPTPIKPASKLRPRNCVTNHDGDGALAVPEITDTIVFHQGTRIDETVKALRERHQELSHLSDYRIVTFWTKKAIKSKGKEEYGTAQKPSGLLKYLTQGADFVIVMSAENCRGLANYEFEAAVYHCLKHCSLIESVNANGDETNTPGIVGHDFEGFIDEMNRYGAWNVQLREGIEPYKAQQLPLGLGA